MKYWDMFNIIPIHQESKQSKTTVIIVTTRMAMTAAAVSKAFLRALFYKNTKQRQKKNKKKKNPLLPWVLSDFANPFFQNCYHFFFSLPTSAH